MSDQNHRAARQAIRARELGVPLPGQPGTYNAITDVPGLEVGYSTVRTETSPVACTGVTVILPRGRQNPASPCAAGVAVLNGNGELTGRCWIDESGQFQTPIGITNSHAVGTVHRGISRWLAKHEPRAAAAWMLPVVSETWDGYLNSINEDSIAFAHVEQALDSAASGAIAEGNVGGGTGMNCYGFKGGTGTSSRLVQCLDRTYTVGVLLQANFGSRSEFQLLGRPLGARSQAPNPLEDSHWFAGELNACGYPAVPGAGSVVAIVATDAPLLPGQCQALARRVPLGLARTGTTGGHFSGDIFLAFSTASAASLTSSMVPPASPVQSLEHLSWGCIDPLYRGVVEATEEAVINALVAAEDIVGRDGHASYALPHGEVRAAFADGRQPG